MIRVLGMIAIAGFFLAVVCIAVAIHLAGPDAITSGAWDWGNYGDGWNMRWTSRHDGPDATRELTWNGGDTLYMDGPADVHFTQADGPPKVVVSGPRDEVDHVVLENGHLRWNGPSFNTSRVVVELSAPRVTHFNLKGSGDLAIQGYHQDELVVRDDGPGDVTAEGSAKSVDMTLHGSGDADLSSLAADRAKVQITGSGDAKVAPKSWAKLEIDGSGDITVIGRPAHQETEIHGSGEVKQDGGGSTSDDDSNDDEHT